MIALHDHQTLEHESSSFPFGFGATGAPMGAPMGGMMGAPMATPMGAPMGRPMFGAPMGGMPPVGMQPGGMPPGGMPGAPMGAPQSQTWLMNKTSTPAFTPPPPAEAAANWANHAKIASVQAKGSLKEILDLRSQAIAKLKELNAKSDKIQDDFARMRETTIGDLRKESQVVWDNYQAAKLATLKMLKAAEDQAMTAKKIVTDAADAKRVTSASFAERSSTAFPKVPANTGDPDVDSVLQSIRDYMAKMKGAAAKPGAPDPLAKAEASAKTESADQSAAQLKAAEADRKAAASDVIKKTPGDADASKYLARLSAATIIHDGAIAVDNALKQAKDSADALVLKEVDAEKKILDLMRQAETARLEAAQEAGQAALKIKQAVDFTREMARKATYAQNAAGQAMAAQMAQAMGFPVTPQGVPSPFPPPTATEASIPVVALSMTAFHQDRRSFLSSCL